MPPDGITRRVTHHTKMSKDIRIITTDSEENETANRDFCTMKEARQWVKDAGLDARYWDRGAEIDGYHKDNVALLSLVVDGDCIQQWTPKWVA